MKKGGGVSTLQIGAAGLYGGSEDCNSEGGALPNRQPGEGRQGCWPHELDANVVQQGHATSGWGGQRRRSRVFGGARRAPSIQPRYTPRRNAASRFRPTPTDQGWTRFRSRRDTRISFSREEVEAGL